MKPAPQPFLPLPGLGVYGERPGHQRAETSREAAVAIAPNVTELQRVVLTALIEAGERGATVHELVARLGRMKDTVAPRLSELRLLGRIEPDGKRAAAGHRAAIVWRVRP